MTDWHIPFHKPLSQYYLAFWAALCLIFLTPTPSLAQSPPEQDKNFVPNINARIFDESRVKSTPPNRFTFSSNGSILDGPKRGSNEPVDYSELLTDKKITTVFLQSVFNCWSFRRECTQPYFRWNTKILPIKAFMEKGALESSEIASIEKILKSGLWTAGFTTPPTTDVEKSAIVFYSGGIDFLKDKAIRLGDRHAVEHFETLDPDYLTWDTLATEKEYPEGASCFVSTEYRATIGRVYIFFHPDDLEYCLPQQLWDAIGLNETPGYFPTITGRGNNFRVPTLVDLVFISALYDDDFPTGGDEDQVRAFFASYLLNHPMDGAPY